MCNKIIVINNLTNYARFSLYFDKYIMRSSNMVYITKRNNVQVTVDVILLENEEFLWVTLNVSIWATQNNHNIQYGKLLLIGEILSFFDASNQLIFTITFK